MRTSKFACLLIVSVCLLLFATVSRLNIPNVSYYATVTNLQKQYNDPKKVLVSKGKGYPPVFAYWIFGTKGESKKMMRLLKAIYHPRNQHLLQLDDCSSDSERMDLALYIKSHMVFEEFGNVNVVGKSYAINKMGSSSLSASLHAASLLLKVNSDWDWFFTLSASDYPLMTQDDILHAFTSLPKNLNFIHYTNKTLRNEQRNMNQIVVDPSLHEEKSSSLYFAVEARDTPDAFKIFRGSPWMILTRSFMEYCVNGWDNLPRKLLMFFSNVAYPMETYFHTVLCNSHEFKNTTVDNNLIFSFFDIDPSEYQLLDMSHYDTMMETGAVFARPFGEGDLVLEKIDDLVLNRTLNGFVQGEWCSSSNLEINKTTNLVSGNIDVVKPGMFGIKLRTLLGEIVNSGRYRDCQCQLQLV
ncbi:putative glucuronosyltransferase [Medicago truncatula]|uniref:Core-2/I-branching enzyme n=1 Tax=Medicago truncatula TaxID=3880 RepID=A0A072URV1_MEDTR|nr:beta-glucuronosyltransferase GlcAT14A [Medicago truncatula]KEH28600.1 core-2/I-branching enzyme [Medicago truncatula]RHN58416.1 putative glucuronosyltransferase [Medicago truncatula]